MRVVVYGRPECGALGFIAEGFQARGHSVIFREDRSAYKRKYVEADKFDLAITDGLRAPMDLMRDEYRDAGLPVLVTDLGYTRKRVPSYFQVGLYQINWLPPFDCPEDRLEHLGLLIEPRKHGDHIVIAGQKAYDAQHYMSHDELTAMYQSWVDEIRRHTDRSIIFRPHPRSYDMRLQGVEHDIPSDRQDGGLPELLNNAHCLVTYNSTAATEALIQGVPVFCMGPAQALPLANTVFSEIEEPFFPSRDQLTAHLAKVAYAQWTADELASGEAVDFITERMLT